VIAANGGCSSSSRLQQLKIAAGKVIALAFENCSTRGDCSGWCLQQSEIAAGGVIAAGGGCGSS
jgi:hypothetical protein